MRMEMSQNDWRFRADVLTREECLRLLNTVPIGRIIFVAEGYPLAYPVNFLATNQAVWIRTDERGALSKLALGERVGFEVDSFDSWQRTGWSVLVAGRVAPANAGDFPSAAPRHLPWPPGKRDNVLRIRTEQISGRRIT